MRTIVKSLAAALFLLTCAPSAILGQPNVHPASTEYEWPTDNAVRQKLEQWQDLKFGIILHWGLYAVPGMIESWALCSEDWIDRDSTTSYDSFKKWYWGLQKEFNPVNFEPEQWAKAAKEAGMRYVVFTTKHHDGFCMFDTKETAFSIARGPFAGNPKADVAKHVFDAFRKENFMIGAYFSKPDWHSEDFWWPKYATPNRNVNYDIRKFPWRWNRFRQFTYNQIQELMTGYGAMDILWLDGGWVRPRETVNEEVLSWGAPIPPFSQEVDMPKIAAMARRAQPGLLIVDRTVHGPYENYQTPEQRIPAGQLPYPWESCMTLANNWGYVPNDVYKPAGKIIQSLVDIVSKGGSLLLGIGPKPDGTLTEEALQRLKEIGAWMKVNGEAVYNTRQYQVFGEGNDIRFTQSKDGKTRYIFLLNTVPKNLVVSKMPFAKGATVQLLGSPRKLGWKQGQQGVEISLPATLQKSRNEVRVLKVQQP